MHIVTRIISMNRARALVRQFREIDRMINGLSVVSRQQLASLAMRELVQSGRCEFPHLYGTPQEQRYMAWGSGTEVGITRARSDNSQVRLRGIALWLAVVFHETRSAESGTLESLHRQVLRVFRQLKQNVNENDIDHAQLYEANEAVA